jgi:hypothetical protein
MNTEKNLECQGPLGERHRLLLEESVLRGVPLVVPIVDGDYAYTIGMPRVSLGCPELTASGPPRATIAILSAVGEAIGSGEVDWKQWKAGSEFKCQRLSVPVRVRVMNGAVRDAYLGQCMSPLMELKQPNRAFVLLWPNSVHKFEEQHIERQLRVFGLDKESIRALRRKRSASFVIDLSERGKQTIKQHRRAASDPKTDEVSTISHSVH